MLLVQRGGGEWWRVLRVVMGCVEWWRVLLVGMVVVKKVVVDV